MVRKIDVEINTNTKTDAGGILKWGPRRRSMVRAWRTAKLDCMPIGVAKNILEDHMGNILIRVLSSSTCWTVHVFHGFATEPSGLMSVSDLNAARFRNLKLFVGAEATFFTFNPPS